MDPLPKPTWQQIARDIHERFVALARTQGSLTSDTEILHFLALAICGEAGELANLIKKSWRGDAVNADAIRDEIADIRIYLEHISRALGIDLDRACEQKLEEVAARLVSKERAAENH